jgi:hypothetical protein
MERNISFDERLPKVVVATAAAIAAIYAPNIWLKGLLAAVAAAASATVVLASPESPNASDRQRDSHPHWRTLKTYRVEA